MLVKSSVLVLASVALLPAPGHAQEQEPASENVSVETEPLPIVVLRDREGEPEKSVVVGSRIPQKPMFDRKTFGIATSTGTPGFVPGSGMDPGGAGIRRITTTNCKASDRQISREVACALLSAKTAMEEADWNLVRGLLVPLAGRDDLSAADRRASADYLYLSARTSGSLPNQIEALDLLIDTDTLSQAETGNALRSLASLYLKAGNQPLAVLALEQAVGVNPDDQRALTNLTILKQNGQVGVAIQYE